MARLQSGGQLQEVRARHVLVERGRRVHEVVQQAAPLAPLQHQRERGLGVCLAQSNANAKATPTMGW